MRFPPLHDMGLPLSNLAARPTLLLILIATWGVCSASAVASSLFRQEGHEQAGDSLHRGLLHAGLASRGDLTAAHGRTDVFSRGVAPVITSVMHSSSGSDEQVFVVPCKANHTCIGGGCVARNSDDVLISEKAQTTEGWRCESTDLTQADMTKRVWAICTKTCAARAEPCPDNKVLDTMQFCKTQNCTEPECCQIPPTCGSYTGTCTNGLVRTPDSAPCSSMECSDTDCCIYPQTCTEWKEQREAANSAICQCSAGGGKNIKIPNFSHKGCKGLQCHHDECCIQAPTCATFDGTDAGCIGTFVEGNSCCSGTCSCHTCYS